MTNVGEILSRRINLGVVAWPLWALGLILVYWFLPLDLMPDAIPIVGLVDDIGVAAGLSVATARRPR